MIVIEDALHNSELLLLKTLLSLRYTAKLMRALSFSFYVCRRDARRLFVKALLSKS